MIKYETIQPGKCYLEVRGSSKDIGCDAAYMMALIYNDLFNASPVCAAKFREYTMHAINGVMDAIERGEFNDNHTA